jgi:predicted N-acetyltransferase YhbS
MQESSMESLTIRSFTKGDVDFAHEMTEIEKWNNTRKDIERMRKLNPLGCFVAEVNGKRIGHVFSVRYGKLGWIGFLIVRAEHRGKGVGTLLMRKTMDHLLSCGAETIKLEAVPKIANIYRKLGFIDEYDSLRFVGKSGKLTSGASSNLTLLKGSMIRKVAEFDAEYFGADRSEVLTRLYSDYPKLCHVSFVESEIVGYIMCRRAESGYRAGPWVYTPRNPQTARELLAKCVQIVEGNDELFVGVPAANSVAVKMMQEFGFEQYSKSIRMRFGKKLETDDVKGIFAIGGPEKG